MYDAYKFMGCVFDEKTGNAVFRTWAPHADSVSVIGEFNDWDENKGKMEPDGSGLFSLAVGGVKTFDAYKFVIHSGEQTIYKADPYAVHAEKNVRFKPRKNQRREIFQQAEKQRYLQLPHVHIRGSYRLVATARRR